MTGLDGTKLQLTGIGVVGFRAAKDETRRSSYVCEQRIEIRIRAGKLRVSGRVVRVKLGCACSYDAKLTLKGRTLARKKGTAQKGATVAIKLSAKQAKAVRKLGRGSKALKLVVVARAGG